MDDAGLKRNSFAQGNRLSCRDQEGRRGSEEAVPGPSVFPSGEPGVSGDFWVKVKGTQSCPTLCAPMDYSMEFSRSEYWSG